MNTVHIVVEGHADQVLLEKLLHDLESAVAIKFHIANGKQSAHTLARTLQVRRGEPVALGCGYHQPPHGRGSAGAV